MNTIMGVTYGYSDATIFGYISFIFVVISVIFMFLIPKRLEDYDERWVIDILISFGSVIVALIIMFAGTRGVAVDVKENIKTAISKEYTDATFIECQLDKGEFISGEKIYNYKIEDRKIIIYINSASDKANVKVIEDK